MNKSELEIKLTGNTIFSESMENAKKIYNSNVEESIETMEKLLQEMKNKIIK